MGNTITYDPQGVTVDTLRLSVSASAQVSISARRFHTSL